MLDLNQEYECNHSNYSHNVTQRTQLKLTFHIDSLFSNFYGDLNLDSVSITKKRHENNMITVTIDNESVNIPSFLIEKKIENIDLKSIGYALTFIGNILRKNILTPNNLDYPVFRKKLENIYRYK